MREKEMVGPLPRQRERVGRSAAKGRVRVALPMPPAEVMKAPAAEVCVAEAESEEDLRAVVERIVVVRTPTEVRRRVVAIAAVVTGLVVVALDRAAAVAARVGLVQYGFDDRARHLGVRHVDDVIG